MLSVYGTADFLFLQISNLKWVIYSLGWIKYRCKKFWSEKNQYIHIQSNLIGSVMSVSHTKEQLQESYPFWPVHVIGTNTQAGFWSLHKFVIITAFHTVTNLMWTLGRLMNRFRPIHLIVNFGEFFFRNRVCLIVKSCMLGPFVVKKVSSFSITKHQLFSRFFCKISFYLTFFGLVKVIS